MSAFTSIFQIFNQFLQHVRKLPISESSLYLETGIKRILVHSSKKYIPIDPQIKQRYNQNRCWHKKGLICWAPFTNLYFSTDGRVISCTYNKTFDLGKYPEQSIEDIRNGENLDNLKKHMLNDDLSLGCNKCYEQIKAGNFVNIPPLSFDDFDHLTNTPIKMQFELENTCNLECIMCCGLLSSSIRKNRDNLPPYPKRYNDTFAEEIKPFIPSLKQANFFGGEPFLIDLYYKIWESIIEINPECTIDIQTNGTILNDRVKRIINRGNFKICVSLESLQKEMYESIRVNAKFDVVMENIRYFSEYSRRKENSFSISVCPMRMNWKELPDIVEFCNKIKAYIYFHTVFYPFNCSIWNLPSSELLEIYEYLQKFEKEGNEEVEKSNARRYEYLITQIKFWYKESQARGMNEEDLKKIGNSELEARIIHKLDGYYNTINEHNNPEQHNIIKERLITIFKSLESNEIQRIILTSILSLPADEVYELLKDNTFEMIKSILKIR